MTEIYQGNNITEYHLTSGQILTLTDEEYNELTEELYDRIKKLQERLLLYNEEAGKEYYERNKN